MVFPKPPLYLDYLKTERENLGQQQHHEPTHVKKRKTHFHKFVLFSQPSPPLPLKTNKTNNRLK